MKMSVVGCEASGKTVFLSALADYYNGGERPCLVPENESANNFQRFQLRQMRSLHQWPAATDPGKVIELKWTLRQNGDVLSEIDLLEFGGETYREAFRGENGSQSHQEAVKTLKQHLASSGFVVVLVSLKDLLRDQGSLSSEEFERETEAIWVTRGLLAFLHEHAPSAKVVIGLTQADLHRGEIAAAGGAENLFRQHWPTIAAAAYGCPVLPVASVSATDEHGNPAPDYTTDGILPVMEEFSKAAKHDAASGRSDSVATRSPSGRSDSVATRSSTRRTLLLLLLLAVAAGLASFFYSDDLIKSVTENSERSSFVVSTPTYAPEIQQPTNIIEKTVTTTNVIEQVVVTTNVVENLVTLTNIVENTVTKTNIINQLSAPASHTSQTPFLRTWHDHRGTPIEAKWIDTTDDGKRIILETAGGKQIRALVRKFSTEDQLYIAEQLNAKTNRTETSANLTL